MLVKLEQRLGVRAVWCHDVCSVKSKLEMEARIAALHHWEHLLGSLLLLISCRERCYFMFIYFYGLESKNESPHSHLVHLLAGVSMIISQIPAGIRLPRGKVLDEQKVPVLRALSTAVGTAASFIRWCSSRVFSFTNS